MAINEMIGHYLNTSVEDCRTSMFFVDDLALLRELLFACHQRAHVSRAKVVAARIRQIEKEQQGGE